MSARCHSELMQRNNRKTASRGVFFRRSIRFWQLRSMHFRVYFHSTGALSGVNEFRLGVGW